MDTPVSLSSVSEVRDGLHSPVFTWDRHLSVFSLCSPYLSPLHTISFSLRAFLGGFRVGAQALPTPLLTPPPSPAPEMWLQIRLAADAAIAGGPLTAAEVRSVASECSSATCGVR